MSNHLAEQVCWVAAFVVPPLLMCVGASLFKGKLFWLAVSAAVLSCWALIFFTNYFYWGWRADDALARQVSDQEMMDATADGASVVFTFILGWIPATIYCSLWLLVFKATSLLQKKLQVRRDEW